MTSTRATPPLLKRLNERTVLETIRAGAPISRAEISRRAGISKPTVSLALQSLLDAGLVREAAAPRQALRRYGAVFFEPVPEAALVLGLDLGARFLRGALCDLARRDPRAAGRRARGAGPAAWTPTPCSGSSPACASRSSRRPVSTASRSTASSSACRGSSEPDRDTMRLVANVARPRGQRLRQRAPGAARASRSPSRTTSTSPRSASSGTASRTASTTSSSSRSAPGSALGSCCAASCTAATTAPPASSTTRASGLDQDIDPCAAALSAIAERLAAGTGHGRSRRRTRRARSSPPRARATRSRAPSVAEEARRIALHIVPVAAVTDVGLVVLGGGIGANGELLPARPPAARRAGCRIRRASRSRASATPPCSTGALAVGLDAALDNVFVSRRPT